MSQILVSLHKISKSYGDRELFKDLSFGLFEKEKIGLVGPNGAGKSTLLKILAQKEEADGGEVTPKRHLKVSYVPQKSFFPETAMVSPHFENELIEKEGLTADEAQVQAAIFLSLCGLSHKASESVSSLSGGETKKLALALGFASDPDLIFLDEPTNHMDWEGVLWLEDHLKSYSKAFVLISHDRKLLNAVTTRTLEINPAFSQGFLSFNVNYQNYQKEKAAYLSQQENAEAVLQNKAKREEAWLRAGVKARTTKSQSRAKEAHQLLEDLSQLKSKNNLSKKTAQIVIDQSQRKTKKLLSLKNLCCGYPKKTLIENFSADFGPKEIIGLVGKNGSGKTTFLKTLLEELPPLKGELKKAPDLKLLYFEQKRSQLPQDQSLTDYLGEGSSHVVFRNESLHVASYASKFLFSPERFHLKISKLSGGEQARLVMAKNLLQPADVLILDEPTNDLDMETLDVLEEVLKSFSGLILLVSHDRSFLESLCTKCLALNEKKELIPCASLSQALRVLFPKKEAAPTPIATTKRSTSPTKKLSYKDKKFLEEAESLISEEEQALQKLNEDLEEAVKENQSQKIQKLSIEISEKQDEIERLFQKWEGLESLSQT